MSLIAELQRRNVFKVGAAYLALAWVIVQITGAIVPALNLPSTLVPIIVWIGVVGFPCVLIFSWVFELTPEGLKRESEIDRSQSITSLTGRRLNLITSVLVVAGIVLVLLDRFVLPRAPIEAQPAESAAVGAGLPANTTAPAEFAAKAAPTEPAPEVVAPSSKSIAVLPFVNMSSDKEQEYFSDGISEELLNQLAQISGLSVAARTSSFAFKGKELEIPEIASRLHVANVLEGSVRKSGDKVRITAQLVRASDGYHLWSDTFDRTLEDIFAVQDEIAGAVVAELKIKLLGAAPKAKAVNPQAYALYLQGRAQSRQGNPEAYERAIALNKQALALDPEYAASWTALSVIYSAQIGALIRPRAEGIPMAREAAARAVKGDPDYALGHTSLGSIALNYDNDLAAAAKHFAHALDLAPEDLRVLNNAIVLADALGRTDNALAAREYIAGQDPLNPISQANLADTYLRVGRYDEAIAHLQTVLALAPKRYGTHASLAIALRRKGDLQGALSEAQLELDLGYRDYLLVQIYHAQGRRAESDAALAAYIEKYAKDDPFGIACLHAVRGESDRAFEWLERAVAAQTARSGFHQEPDLESLHTDARWLPLLRRLGTAPEQLAAIPFEIKLPN